MSDPIARFTALFEKAKAVEPHDATAVTLATADARGRPSARMVLLKGADARGFVFFTNRESRKGRELAENPFAALCIHWPASQQQVRIEGRVERASDAESDAYFAGRPRESQLGAWASKQSEPLASREELEARVAELAARWPGDVPRAARTGEATAWCRTASSSGSRARPASTIASSTGGAPDDGWTMTRLNP